MDTICQPPLSNLHLSQDATFFDACQQANSEYQLWHIYKVCTTGHDHGVMSAMATTTQSGKLYSVFSDGASALCLRWTWFDDVTFSVEWHGAGTGERGGSLPR
jgi:hypothetical protein